MSRHVARFLAPLAIAAVAVGIYLVVHANLAGHSRVAAPAQVSGRAHQPPHHSRSRVSTPVRSRSYTVRPGDTLSAISSRTGVSLTRLVSLNPRLKPPYDLQSGERLRLGR